MPDYSLKLFQYRMKYRPWKPTNFEKEDKMLWISHKQDLEKSE